MMSWWRLEKSSVRVTGPEGALEGVLFGEEDHGEDAKGGRESVGGAEGCFFLGEEVFTGDEPFVLGYDLGGCISIG
jgi:hypothetical protein